MGPYQAQMAFFSLFLVSVWSGNTTLADEIADQRSAAVSRPGRVEGPAASPTPRLSQSDSDLESEMKKLEDEIARLEKLPPQRFEERDLLLQRVTRHYQELQGKVTNLQDDSEKGFQLKEKLNEKLAAVNKKVLLHQSQMQQQKMAITQQVMAAQQMRMMANASGQSAAKKGEKSGGGANTASGGATQENSTPHLGGVSVFNAVPTLALPVTPGSSVSDGSKISDIFKAQEVSPAQSTTSSDLAIPNGNAPVKTVRSMQDLSLSGLRGTH